jgi:hypothetical protein
VAAQGTGAEFGREVEASGIDGGRGHEVESDGAAVAQSSARSGGPLAKGAWHGSGFEES